MINHHSSEWSLESGAGDWNKTFGHWQVDGAEVVITSACRLECILPEGGALNVGITLEGLQGSQGIGKTCRPPYQLHPRRSIVAQTGFDDFRDRAVAVNSLEACINGEDSIGALDFNLV